MTLTEISYKLQELAMTIEKFSHDRISEELFVIADYVDDLENDVTGTIVELNKGIKDLESMESKLKINDNNILNIENVIS